MKQFTGFALLIALVLGSVSAFGLDVYKINGEVHSYSLAQLRAEKQESFVTERFKHDKKLVENWSGIRLQNWLSQMNFNEFQSIRFESDDNYMVRIHKAELDSMPGFIVLSKDGAVLDSTEVRIIFPKQRDMFWVRGVSRIYLEDFNPAPPPHQIFVWDAVTTDLELVHEPHPFVNISGYPFDTVMSEVFHADAGSVILVSRDGLKLRLEYPKHLKGAVMEKTSEENYDLKSPVIPAGMWLKDIVYMQCGPVAVIRYDFLYLLPTLYKTLDWSGLTPSDKVHIVTGKKTEVRLESLYQPGAPPFTTDDWIELP